MPQFLPDFAKSLPSRSRYRSLPKKSSAAASPSLITHNLNCEYRNTVCAIFYLCALHSSEAWSGVPQLLKGGLRAGGGLGLGEGVPFGVLGGGEGGADGVAGLVAGVEGLFCEVGEVRAVEGAGLLELESFVGVVEEGGDFVALGLGEGQFIEAAFEEEGLGGEEGELVLNQVDALAEDGVLGVGGDVFDFGGARGHYRTGLGGELVERAGIFSGLGDQRGELELEPGEEIGDLFFYTRG